jgi:hypothetical protein
VATTSPFTSRVEPVLAINQAQVSLPILGRLVLIIISLITPSMRLSMLSSFNSNLATHSIRRQTATHLEASQLPSVPTQIRVAVKSKMGKTLR